MTQINKSSFKLVFLVQNVLGVDRRPLQNVDISTDTMFYTQNIQMAPERYSIKYFTVTTTFS